MPSKGFDPVNIRLAHAKLIDKDDKKGARSLWCAL